MTYNVSGGTLSLTGRLVGLIAKAPRLRRVVNISFKAAVINFIRGKQAKWKKEKKKRCETMWNGTRHQSADPELRCSINKRFTESLRVHSAHCNISLRIFNCVWQCVWQAFICQVSCVAVVAHKWSQTARVFFGGGSGQGFCDIFVIQER